MNKKAAEMTIGTIIVIILALVVLIAIVYGFSVGWQNLWAKITNFGGGKVNVQSIVESCNLACTVESQYEYCTLERKVVFGNEKDNQKDMKYTCKTLVDQGIGLNPCTSITCPAGN